METPGHTADSVTYRIGDCAFAGDLVFMPDCGTGRCDFPGGDAATLHASIEKLLALPAATRIFLGHDYPPAGREPCCESSVSWQIQENIHLTQHASLASFVDFRQARDRTLSLPALMIPAIQMNALGGALPPPAANGHRYLKFPIDAL